MRAVVAAVATGAATLVTAVPAPATAGATPTITRSAHVAFDDCNAQHIVLTVTVAGRAFTPAEPVTYTVRLRNTGAATCRAPLAQHVPQARRSLTVGPCGVLSLIVSDALGVNVYPGPVAYSCPDEVGLRLGPHSTTTTTTTTTGSWNQSETIGSGEAPATVQHAPPGKYRLAVDQAVSVPVTLAPG
jgi:hypothetical protein